MPWLVLVLALLFFGVLLLSVRLGAALARIQNVRLGVYAKLAAGLLVLTIASWAFAFVLEDSGTAPALLIIAVGPLLALPLIRRVLEASWGKTMIVWIVQGIGLTTCLVMLATFISPGLIQPRSVPNQKMAMSEMRSIGVGLLAWAADQTTDEVLPTATLTVTSIDSFSAIEMPDLVNRLVPTYLSELPDSDPWGTPYDVRVLYDSDGRMLSVCVRCAGNDRAFSTYDLSPHVFSREHAEEDIVWLDGDFIRQPEGFAN